MGLLKYHLEDDIEDCGALLNALGDTSWPLERTRQIAYSYSSGFYILLITFHDVFSPFNLSMIAFLGNKSKALFRTTRTT